MMSFGDGNNQKKITFMSGKKGKILVFEEEL
jgi:hypothetical protein